MIIKRLQCKDIPTMPILEFIGKHGGIGCNWCWLHDERCVRHAMPAGSILPDRLVLAKMRKLIAKGYVDGCDCGCRGDFELTDKGREAIMMWDIQRALTGRLPTGQTIVFDGACIEFSVNRK